MGREIKRVPLDFDHPIGKTWPGYVIPSFRKCPDCGGSGETLEGKALTVICRLLTLAGDESLKRPEGFNGTGKAILIPHYPGGPNGKLYPHPYLIEAGVDDVGPNFHKLITPIEGPPGLFGYSNCWKLMQALMRAAGLEDDFAVCGMCGASGTHPDDRAAADAWEVTDPPAGDGWQVWQTVGEGSPISPVFATDVLCVDWLVNSQKYSREGASAFVKSGWVPSGVVSDGVMYPDIESAVLQEA